MRTTCVRIGVLATCAVWIGLWPSAAGAQGVARDFAELQGRVLIGETVTATDQNGQVTKGKLVSLTPSELTLNTQTGLRTLPGSDLTKVQARRMGPLWNGAVIGAAVGIVPFAIAGGNCYDCNLAAPALLSGAIGAAIGVGIDALVKGNVTVMRAEDSGKKVALAPLVAKDRKGVLLSVRF